MKRECAEAIFDELAHFAPSYRKKVTRGPLTTGKFPLSPLQHMTLAFIYRNGPLPMSAVAEFHGISKQQVTPIINSLVMLGFVQRKINKANRRQILVSATRKGETILAQSRKYAVDNIVQRFGGLTDEEAKEVVGHLQALNAFLNDGDAFSAFASAPKKASPQRSETTSSTPTVKNAIPANARSKK